MPFVNVKLVEGVLSTEENHAMAATLTGVMVQFEGSEFPFILPPVTLSDRTEAEMFKIDHDVCTQLVCAIADEIAASSPLVTRAGSVADAIAHVRAVSDAAAMKLRTALADHYPGIGWTHETSHPTDEVYWLYDPIDGAYHWLQGLPLWSSSLVLVCRGEPVFAIVYDATMQEVFVAAKGEGATCNGATVRAAAKSELAACVAGTAIPPLAQVGAVEHDDALDLLRTVARAVFVVRPMAATSLQLAYVAAGRLDAYFEIGHDVADWLAGALLVREAKGIVTDLSGRPFGWLGDGILAGSANLHAAMVTAIKR